MAGSIRREHHDLIGEIIVDHPQRRNAVTAAMWAAIPAAVQAWESDPAVRVIVLRGAGDTAFVSGADVSEFTANRRGAGVAEYDLATERAMTAVALFAKPVVALIHGF